MKEIIKNCYSHFETIKIAQDTPILEYLANKDFPFRLQQVSHEKFLEIQNAKDKINIEYDHFIAGFSPFKGKDFYSSGGLKVSDPEEKIHGSFIIKKKRIIYDAILPFYKERDAFVYGGFTYYTEMSMLDILKEELIRKREFLIYMGEKYDKEQYHCHDLFEEVSEEEFLKYAIDPSKGEQALVKRIHF